MSRARRGQLLVAAAVTLGILVATGSSAIAGRLTVRDAVYHHPLSVSPSHGLSDGQYVRVQWHGYRPGLPVFFRQCTARPTNVALDCTSLYTDTGFTDSDGTGVLFEKVTEGSVPSQKRGHHFTCNDSTPCTFGVFANGSLATGSFASIHFAPSPSSCPPPLVTPIIGEGADEASQAFFQWGLQACRAPLRLSVNYAPFNSQDGQQKYAQGLDDFAVTTTPFAGSSLAAAHRAHKAFSYAPVTASALVLAYKVFDQDPAAGAPGAQVTDLKLTPQLVAQIFTGQLTNWQLDPTINALNPGHHFPPTVRPLVRSDHSEASLVFTGWLTAEGGSGLPKGWPGATDSYPLNYVTQNGGVSYGDPLAAAIADPNTQRNSNDYYSIGYIGFVDSSEAAYYGLPTARIENAAGKFVAATPASISAAIKHMHRGPSGVLAPNFTTKDPNAYPMPIVSYATAATAGISSGGGAALREFLHYALTTGQHTLPGGYAPLPAGLRNTSLAAIARIPGTASGTGIPAGSGGPIPTSGGSPGPSPTPPQPSGGKTPTRTGPSARPGGSHVAGLPVGRLTETAGRLLLPGIAGLGCAALIAGIALELLGEGRRARLARFIARLRSGRLRSSET